MDGWSFGDIFWSAIVFCWWFSIIWMFIAIFADLVRRSMSGWAKAGWILLLIVLPFLGALVYVVARPRDGVDGAMTVYGGGPRHEPGYRAADEIATAARLHDEGKLTDAEFEQIKERALSR
jgi:hypothetical protein